MGVQEIVRWGIIGCGDVCEIKSGPAFSKVRSSELVAVMRRNAEKAKDFAQRHGVPAYYTDAASLIIDPGINAVYIATPPAFHEEYASMAMQAGKPVYIEKPVTLDAASCRRLIDLSEKTGIPATVAHYRRELPLFLKIREMITNNLIGDVNGIKLHLYQSSENNIIAKSEMNWRIDPSISGGGLFHDLAPHQLDILVWLFGKPISFEGSSKNNGGYYNAPDYTQLRAVFQQNITFEGTWNFNVLEDQAEDYCEITGEKGSLVFSFFRSPILTWHNGSETHQFRFDIPEHIQQPMISKVVTYLLGENDNPCSLADALISMEMMDATLRTQQDK